MLFSFLMVVVKIMEGLGNQMLQYAVGKHLSLRNNSALYLDLSWFASHKDQEHPREFGLDKFRTKYNTVDFRRLLWRFRFTDHFKKVNPFKLKNIKEQNYAEFDPQILQAGDNILLEGYFNSHKYFEDIRETLLADFTPAKKLDSLNLACLQKIENTNSVGLHIRRGDYANTDFHGILDKTYYNNAIEYVSRQAGAIHLFIFSDEPDWVQEHMQFAQPYDIINFNKDERSYFDMELMKHCKHNIIANSTFSWWSAWLNANPGKIVVAPQKWFNSGKGNAENIPSTWKLL